MRLRIKKRSRLLLSFGATLVAVAIFGVAVYNLPADISNAASETVSAPATATGRVNAQLAIAGVSIGGSGNDVIPVKVQVTQGSLYLVTKTGLTFTTTTTGSTISFSGTRTNVNAALATLHYVGTVAGSQTVTISLADTNTIYNPTNGHVYQYVGGGSTWPDAFDAAAALNYQGVPGYLATITSQDENDFIKDRLSGDAWLGASDNEEEGVWKWVAGPETGDNFYTGEGLNGSGPDAGLGAAVDGAYTNWAYGEPNQAGVENCMETYIQDGTWNDYPCDNDTVGYVVEYGNDITNPTSIPSASVNITVTAATFAGGDGTPEDPYQVTDCERLQGLNQNLTASYVLTQNIDCTDTPNWNGGQGFVPIGYNNDGMSDPFRGTIEGNGYSINGLTEIRSDDDPDTDHDTNPEIDQSDVGLIGYGAGIEINNLHLTNAKIKGYRNVGGLVGYMSHGAITNSSVNAALGESSNSTCGAGYCIEASGSQGGGLVGYMVAGTIDGSTVGGLVGGSGDSIGGLVGSMVFMAHLNNSDSTTAVYGNSRVGGAVGDTIGDSSVYRVSTSGSVKALILGVWSERGLYAGGLVGHAENTAIEQSYATGSVHAARHYAGGISGYFLSGTMNDVFTSSPVTALYYIGGLAGEVEDSTFNRVYASGTVSGEGDVGSLVSFAYQYPVTITDSFATGFATSDYDKGAISALFNYGANLSEVYYDATSTGTGPDMCLPDGDVPGCMPINVDGSQAAYFTDYRNAPFAQTGSQIWDIDDVWYFDGVNHPVLRMGTNMLASKLPTVDDHDGISTAIENAAPNAGDGNNDGTQDSEQANVVSFVNPVTAKYVTIEVNDTCSITTASSAAVQTNSDKGYSYPFGLLSFALDCGIPGFTTNVKIYYHDLDSSSGLVVRKYNNTTHVYTAVSSAIVGGSLPVTLSYTLTDGGLLDEDGAANGTIIDPIGLALQNGALVGAPNTGLKAIKDTPVLVYMGVGSIVFLTAAYLVFRRTAKSDSKD